MLDRIKNRSYSKSDLVLLENIWSLILIQNINSDRTQILKNSKYIIDFNKNTLRFSGTLDCNRFSGRLSLKDNKLNLFMGPVTLRGCLHFPSGFSSYYSDKASNKITKSAAIFKESLYSKQTNLIEEMISDVVGYEIKKHELMLFTQDSRKLFFK